MSDVINLKQIRKRKARDDKARLADENRIRFGRTKAEKIVDNHKIAQDVKFLDQNRLEQPVATNITRLPETVVPDKQPSSSSDDLL